TDQAARTQYHSSRPKVLRHGISLCGSQALLVAGEHKNKPAGSSSGQSTAMGAFPLRANRRSTKGLKHYSPEGAKGTQELTWAPAVLHGPVVDA
ncbi:hypothetical protein HaLaN_19985, partial [Haematococcus lacustris]